MELERLVYGKHDLINNINLMVYNIIIDMAKKDIGLGKRD